MLGDSTAKTQRRKETSAKQEMDDGFLLPAERDQVEGERFNHSLIIIPLTGQVSRENLRLDDLPDDHCTSEKRC